VVGVTIFIATIPALLVIDKLGRRPLIIMGGIGMLPDSNHQVILVLMIHIYATGMCMCLIIVAALTATFQSNWGKHTAAAWTSATFIWVYIFNFGYSWG
jgi:hypothetical protein